MKIKPIMVHSLSISFCFLLIPVWVLLFSEPARLTLAASFNDCASRPSSCMNDPLQSEEIYDGQVAVAEYTDAIYTDVNSNSDHHIIDQYFNRVVSQEKDLNRFSDSSSSEELE
jgi:hypothetical protein